MYVDGALSEPLEVNIGVPQGSILGPLLYTIFTNELPEFVHKHYPQDQQGTTKLFNTHFQDCGGICCFADDLTFTISNKDPIVLQQDMNNKYKDIVSYMAMNKLFLNTDKTHVLIMTSAVHHKKQGNFGIALHTGAETILPSENERLLGAQISNDFTWNEHVIGNDKSMVKMITSRINALRKISWSADFKTRKMIANAIVMSRIIYLIQVYGTASDYLINFLQVLQNKAARVVTKLRWGTETKLLLNQVGWLSVRQLVVFHSLILVFKTKQVGKPIYLREKLRSEFAYETRQSTGNCFVKNDTPRSEKYKKAFVHNSTSLWNSLSLEVRTAVKLEDFKTKLRKWIKINTPV